jgi:hypothetical protein
MGPQGVSYSQGDCTRANDWHSRSTCEGHHIRSEPTSGMPLPIYCGHYHEHARLQSSSLLPQISLPLSFELHVSTERLEYEEQRVQPTKKVWAD